MRPTLIAILLILMLTTGTLAPAQAPPAVASGPAIRQSSGAASDFPQIGLPAGAGEQTLRVFIGRSIVVRVQEPLKRASVTDPVIASAVVVAPDQIMIHGLKAGTVTLLLWDEQERLRSFDLQVLLDIRPIAANLKQLFPRENIEVSQSGAALVLTGEVSGQAVADKAVALAQTEATAVVSMLRTRSQMNDTVMLQVRFAEVDRTAVQQLGINILSTGAANTIGDTTTQQFGSLAARAGATAAGGAGGTTTQGLGSVAGAIGQKLANTPATFGLSDLLNIFVFRSDLNLGVVIRALQQRNLLQILAEPNLLAVNGKEASFLAGGEFPFPVVQGGTGLTAVTIQFKEFGIKLKFTANLLDDDVIRLKVAPEVSALDFANALTISGFLIPAISTRRADTEVDLRDGQSFAIAGLIDNRLTEIASKIPWLGDVPVIGKLFRSRSVNRNNTELMVLVTPKLVKPLDPSQVPPTPPFPAPFLDGKKFDGKTGETPPQTGSNPPPIKKRNDR
jgi:pilus assembly protein CpaC